MDGLHVLWICQCKTFGKQCISPVKLLYHSMTIVHCSLIISIMYINQQGPNMGLMCTKSQKVTVLNLHAVVPTSPNPYTNIIYKFSNYVQSVVPLFVIYLCAMVYSQLFHYTLDLTFIGFIYFIDVPYIYLCCYY